MKLPGAGIDKLPPQVRIQLACEWIHFVVELVHKRGETEFICTVKKIALVVGLSLILYEKEIDELIDVNKRRNRIAVRVAVHRGRVPIRIIFTVSWVHDPVIRVEASFFLVESELYPEAVRFERSCNCVFRNLVQLCRFVKDGPFLGKG